MDGRPFDQVADSSTNIKDTALEDIIAREPNFEDGDLVENMYEQEAESDDETDEEEELEEDNMFSEEFKNFDSERIHPAIDLSKLCVLKMVLIYFMRHNLTLVGLEDLLKLINGIVGGNSLFTSKYKFFKVFSKPYTPKNYFFCKECKADLDVDCDLYEGIKRRNKECPNCKKSNQINSTTENNYFVIYPLENLLKEVITQNIEDFVCDREQTNDSMSDITDGDLYKSGTQYLNRNHKITLTLNTDGVQVFKSKNKSLWPIQFTINELPINKRFQTKNILVTGLWFNSTHPPMELFLKPVLKELIELQSTGLTVKYKKQDWTFDVNLICATLDAPAKSSVQNIVLHSGYYSCHYCEHPGELVDQFVKYPNQNHLKKRNHDDAVSQMLLAHEKNEQSKSNKQNTKVQGFKGISPLIAAPGFDLINGFGIDYLHSVCEGVVKHLLYLWFDTSNHGKDYYIKPSIAEVNDNISKIQLPSEIARNPRSLLERHQWKANEFRAWLLFFSVGALYNILDSKFLKHYMNLVAAIKIYLQKNITKDEMLSAKNKIQSFVREFQILYGKNNMRYNVHTISHMPDCVQTLGPLWAYSNFPFEDNNGKLTNYVNAPKGVLHQISGKYTLSRVMATPNFFNSDPVKAFQKSVSHHKHFTTSDRPLKPLGSLKSVQIDNIEDINANKYIFDTKDFLSYDKFMLNNIIYSTSSYCKSKKCNDSIIKLKTNIYGEIVNIISQKEEMYIVLKMFNIIEDNNYVFLFCPDFVHVKKSNIFVVVSVNLIEYKCCLISLKNIKYITPFQNFCDD